MKSSDKKKSEDFYKLFKPQLTPQKMLEMGVFGGSYFDGKIKEYPKSWFKKAKLSKNFDVSLNRFRIKSGLSRKEGLSSNLTLNLVRFFDIKNIAITIQNIINNIIIFFQGNGMLTGIGSFIGIISPPDSKNEGSC